MNIINQRTIQFTLMGDQLEKIIEYHNSINDDNVDFETIQDYQISEALDAIIDEM